MPRLLKPDIDGFDDTDTGASFYDGPPPPPGVYNGVIKQLALAKIATGESKGKKRLHLVVEITDGKFKGAGLVHSLNMTTQGNPFVNQFLRSLTDGSEEQWVGIRKAFWRTGYTVDDQPDAKNRFPILKIGKKFNPIGKPLSFVTRMRPDNNGVQRADITRFVIPFQDNGEEPEPEEDEYTSDLDDALDEFASETTSNPEPEASYTREVKGSPVEAVDLDEDADDPWS